MFPLFKDVKYQEVVLEEGQCLFVPAMFYLQT